MAEGLCHPNHLNNEILHCCACKSLLQDPRMLPCFHGFCLKCIEAYTRQKQPDEEASCPLCKHSFIVPNGGIQDLPVNDFVEKLLKVEKSVNSVSSNFDKSCDGCSIFNSNVASSSLVEKNLAARWRCISCSKNICNDCSAEHVGSEGGSQHELVELDQYERQQLIADMPSYCKEHVDSVVVSYCRDCCLMVCQKCLDDGSHVSHACADIDVVADEFRLFMQDRLNDITRQMEMSARKMRQLEAQRKSLEEFEQIERIIKRKNEELKALVDNDTNQLLMSLQEVRKNADGIMTGDDLNSEDALESVAAIANLTEGLTFTVSQFGSDGRNLIGQIVVVETTGDDHDLSVTADFPSETLNAVTDG